MNNSNYCPLTGEPCTDKCAWYLVHYASCVLACLVGILDREVS